MSVKVWAWNWIQEVLLCQIVFWVMYDSSVRVDNGTDDNHIMSTIFHKWSKCVYLLSSGWKWQSWGCFGHLSKAQDQHMFKVVIGCY